MDIQTVSRRSFLPRSNFQLRRFTDSLNKNAAVEIPAEKLWEWFQQETWSALFPEFGQMSKTSTPQFLPSGKIISFIRNLGLPFNKYIYFLAIEADGRRFGGNAFVRYLQLLNNQRPDLKNLCSQALKFDVSSPYLPEFNGDILKFRANDDILNSYDSADRDIINGVDFSISSSWESGDFYCEHIGFLLNDLSRTTPSFVHAQGEPLVGFMHIPARNDDVNNPKRFDNTISVMALALRGYYQELLKHKSTQQGMRILLTGFKEWNNWKDKDVYNLSGDYVKAHKNIDATMKKAFGKALLEAQLTIETAAGKVLRYFVRDKSCNKIVPVDILTKELTVNERSINGREGSLQDVVAKFQPHAAISLGMTGGQNEFVISSFLDNSNLVKTADGFTRNTDAYAATDGYINFSLERAVKKGWDMQMRPVAVS